MKPIDPNDVDAILDLQRRQPIDASGKRVRRKPLRGGLDSDHGFLGTVVPNGQPFPPDDASTTRERIKAGIGHYLRGQPKKHQGPPETDKT